MQNPAAWRRGRRSATCKGGVLHNAHRRRPDGAARGHAWPTTGAGRQRGSGGRPGSSRRRRPGPRRRGPGTGPRDGRGSVITVALLVALGGLVILGLVMGVRRLDGYSWRRSLMAFRLGLPLGVSHDDVAAWLAHVVASTHVPRFGFVTPPPVALEVTATAAGILHTLLVPSGMQGAVLSALRAALPGVRLEAAPDYLATRPRVSVAAEGRLSNLSRPLAHDRAERASAALLAALAPLAPGEPVTRAWVFVGAAAHAPVAS